MTVLQLEEYDKYIVCAPEIGVRAVAVGVHPQWTHAQQLWLFELAQS